MALKYSLTLNTDDNIVSALLTNQGSWVNLTPEYLRIVDLLQKRNFISYNTHHFVKCYNPSDKKDLPFVTHQFCSNRIYITPDFDDNCEDVICDNCMRYIAPNRTQKQQFIETIIKINFTSIAKFIEQTLQKQQLAFHAVSQGVYHVSTSNGFVVLILLDRCNDTRYLASDKIKAIPTILLHLHTKTPVMSLKVPSLSIANIINDQVILQEMINAAHDNYIPETIPNQSSNILAFPKVNLSIATPYNKQKRLEVHLEIDGVYINDIHVISKNASSQLMIFYTLLKQYWRDFLDVASLKDHNFLNINQLADSMSASDIEINDVEQQIRRPLNKMQHSIIDKLAQKSGLTIQKNDIIEICGWPGVSTKKQFGYRLNPQLLFKK